MLQSLRLISITICSLFVTVLASSQSSHPLLIAVKNNNVKQVESLLEDGANASNIDDDSDNVLMCATMYATPEVMELLLKKGAKINSRNKSGETALMWCMHDNNKINLLLKYGADINVAAYSGNTPLFIACVGADQYEIVKLLLDKGADALARNNKKETALMRTAMFGDTATISLLLNKGIDINARDQDGMTALMHAILNSNRAVALQLLEHGADPDLAMSFGLTSLCCAVIYDDVETVNAVLKKTKNVNAVHADGHTPLMWAAYNEYANTKIIQALLDKGEDINFKAADGSTALSWALKKGNTASVELLKKAGAK